MDGSPPKRANISFEFLWVRNGPCEAEFKSVKQSSYGYKNGDDTKSEWFKRSSHYEACSRLPLSLKQSSYEFRYAIRPTIILRYAKSLKFECSRPTNNFNTPD